MIYDVLKYLNNFFARSVESSNVVSVNTDTVVTANGTYLVGQYVLIHSILNEGVYKVKAIGTNQITLEGALVQESNMYLLALVIPKPLLTLITDIQTYDASNVDGISSESQGARSISYVSGSGWVSVYQAKLRPYKRIYSDLETMFARCDQNRWC